MIIILCDKCNKEIDKSIEVVWTVKEIGEKEKHYHQRCIDELKEAEKKIQAT